MKVVSRILPLCPPPNCFPSCDFAFFQEFSANRHIVEVGHDKAGLIKAVENHIYGHGMFTEYYIVCYLSRCRRFSKVRSYLYVAKAA